MAIRMHYGIVWHNSFDDSFVSISFIPAVFECDPAIFGRDHFIIGAVIINLPMIADEKSLIAYGRIGNVTLPTDSRRNTKIRSGMVDPGPSLIMLVFVGASSGRKNKATLRKL